jgi:hypothetical protein
MRCRKDHNASQKSSFVTLPCQETAGTSSVRIANVRNYMALGKTILIFVIHPPLSRPAALETEETSDHVLVVAGVELSPFFCAQLTAGLPDSD